MQTRIEHDTMGEVAVPSEALWGAQTQRSCKTSRSAMNACHGQ